MRSTLILSLALAGCTVPGTGTGKDSGAGGDGGASTADGGGTDGGSTGYQPCVETWVDHVGPDEPVVGDEWTIWLYCDGVLLTGPTAIRFDPLEFASVNENIVTWDTAGTGTIRVQTGSEWAEEEVTVSAGP